MKLFQKHKFSRWINNHKLADLLYSGLYRETSQTADSGIILNNWLNKELKVYLREEHTHLVFPVSQHKLCHFIAGSHQRCPSSPPPLLSVPRQPYHLPPTHQNLLFTQKKLLTIASPGTLLTLFFSSMCDVISAVTSHISHRSESALKWVPHTLKQCQHLP